MKKLLILWLISFSSVLFAQTISTKSAMELERECNSKNSQSCLDLGFKYYRGEGISIDKFQALEYFQKACNDSNIESCFNLAVMYSNGDSVRQDKFIAIQLYQKACDGGILESCLNVGVMYYNGDGIRQDKSKAVWFYQKACDKNHSNSCFNLGVLYEDGEGVRQDKSKALNLFSKACDLKNQVGCQEYNKLKNISIFRDTNGEGINPVNLIYCKFLTPTPDGESLFFTPTDAGNLSQTFREGANTGLSTIYKYTGESDSKFYRIYSTNNVTVAVHQTKPAVVMIFNKSQYIGNCHKVIPNNF
jgi:hypothetical protein